MESLFVAVIIAISVFSVIFCIVRGRGASHRKLVFFSVLLCMVAMVCFGGQAVLTCFGMGWRCTPFNTMLGLSIVLFIVVMGFGMKELSALKENTNPAIVWCGCISMLLMIIVTLLFAFLYFLLSSWHDSLSSLNGQMIVCSNDMHGGSCYWRYYNHINSLIHGVEITQDSWWGYPPF